MGRLCGGAHEISGNKAPLFLCGGWLEGSWSGWVVVGGGMVVAGWVGGWMGGCGVGGGVLGVGGCWCVGWICITHVWSLTLFPWGILIFQGVLI